MTFRTALAILAGAALGGLLAAPVPALAGFVPHGTYPHPCRSIHVNGPTLTTIRARDDGSWRWTQIFVPRYGGIEISNQNGRLTCGE